MTGFVTGGTGFIGSHLVDALLADGHTVRCLVRGTARRPWLEGKPVELVQGTLEDSEVLARGMRGADVVFHVAGLTAARSREEFFHGNVDATRTMLAAAAAAPGPPRFVHVSSLAAVGPATKDHPVDESTPYHPITAYGESKKAAEDEVFRYAGRLPVAIVRPPAVYGPRDTGIFSFFQTVNAGIMPLIGFSEKRLSLVHARDVVQGLLRAAVEPGAIGEAFFVSSERYYTWREVGEIAKRVMGKRAMAVHVPHALVALVAGVSEFFGRFQAKPPVLDREKGKDIVQGYWTCDIKKAKEILHYRESVNLADGIQETVDWYRANGWL